MTRDEEKWASESQKYLADIYARAGIGISRSSPVGEIYQANPKLCEFLGYSENELIGLNFVDLTHPEDRPFSQQIRQKISDLSITETTIEKRYLHKLGHTVWGQVSIIPARHADGAVDYCVTAIVDITERRLAEQLMRHQNEVLRLMALNRPLTETLERIVRLIEEQAPGCTSTIYLVEDGRIWLGAAPSFPKSFVEAVNGASIGPQAGSCGAAAFSGQRVVSTDVRVDDCWGPYREWFQGYGYAAAWSTPVLSREGKVIGTVSMCWKEPKEPTQRHFELADVATKLMGIAIERDRNEKTMQEQQAKMIASSKLAALGEMAGGLAHEINNPLAIISGRSNQLKLASKAGMLNHGFVDEVSESIERTTQRISQIVRGLKAFAREGDHEELQRVCASALLEDTLSFCRERFRAHGVGLTVTCPQLLELWCRPVQMSQVLLNLLNNSFDAVERLPEKWVRVGVEEAGDGVLFSVTDSGSGIEEGLHEKVLQPFFTTKDPGRGTGLGLSVSNSIVAAHGGTLTIDKGSRNTRFVVALPRRNGP